MRSSLSVVFMRFCTSARTYRANKYTRFLVDISSRTSLELNNERAATRRSNSLRSVTADWISSFVVLSGNDEQSVV